MGGHGPVYLTGGGMWRLKQVQADKIRREDEHWWPVKNKDSYRSLSSLKLSAHIAR